MDTIEDILDHFDFEKVRKAMVALDWKWASVGDVPSIADMRKTARTLLRYCEEYVGDDAYYYTATGGFWACVRQYPGDAKKYFSLKFVVSEWDNYDQD